MPDRALEVVRRRVVALMRADPPGPAHRGPYSPALDRWMASRLTAEELAVLFRHESTYGEAALAEWFAEALLEAGVVRLPRALAS